MSKIIILYLLIINTSLAFSKDINASNEGISFKNFAVMSAILNQCELEGLGIEKNKILPILKEEGLKIAEKNHLSSEDIAKEVALILYELDDVYSEKIPLPICMNSLRDFKYYLKNFT